MESTNTHTIKLVFPTPESPKIITFRRAFFLCDILDAAAYFGAATMRVSGKHVRVIPVQEQRTIGLTIVNVRTELPTTTRNEEHKNEFELRRKLIEAPSAHAYHHMMQDSLLGFDVTGRFEEKYGFATLEGRERRKIN
jgi:hypothetical protein